MNFCIYCKKPYDMFSLEHIIPDSIGCPEILLLKNEVCTKCNNILAKIDNKVIQSFDIVRIMNGIKNKKGKLPSLSSIRNIHTDDKNEETRMIINNRTDDIKIEEIGKILPGFKKGSTALKAEITINNKDAIVRLSQPFSTDRQFIRGIYKIAFELQCFVDGANTILDPYFDSFRNFIFNDIGEEELFYEILDDGLYKNSLEYTYDNDGYKKIIVFRLVNIRFIVNMTKNEEFYDYLFNYMREDAKHNLKYVRTKGKDLVYY